MLLETTLDRSAYFRSVMKNIYTAIQDLKTNGDSSEDGRAKSLVITKLEEAMLWLTQLYPENNMREEVTRYFENETKK